MRTSRVKGFEQRKKLLYQQVLGKQHGLEWTWDMTQKSLWLVCRGKGLHWNVRSHTDQVGWASRDHEGYTE